jgi:hypothetical protein
MVMYAHTITDPMEVVLPDRNRLALPEAATGTDAAARASILAVSPATS